VTLVDNRFIGKKTRSFDPEIVGWGQRIEYLGKRAAIAADPVKPDAIIGTEANQLGMIRAGVIGEPPQQVGPAGGFERGGNEAVSFVGSSGKDNIYLLRSFLAKKNGPKQGA
jgi:hypothetical protein